MHLLQILLLTATTAMLVNAKLIYEAKFKNTDDANSQLVLEGPGEIFLTNNKEVLNMRSIYQRDLYDFWSEETDDGTNGVILQNSDIYNELENICEQKTPELCESLKRGGKFKGGHIVVWIKRSFPKNFKITFDMKSVDPLGLFILFFSAHPKNDPKGSIFDDSLPSRNGIYTQYTSGKINNYGISYSARFTGSPRGAPSRMRKNTGAKIIKKGTDYASEQTGVWYSIKVIKRGKKIEFYIDGELVFKYKATSKKDMHKSGYIGFRQMVTTWGEYRNIKVYSVR